MIVVFGVAVAVNFAWEMLQMGAFSDFSSPVLWCGIASVGDALYTTLLYVGGSKLTGDRTWIFSLNPRRVVAVFVAGFVTAMALERLALAIGFWSYRRTMIMVPIVRVGLWPALQLMLLPFVVFWVAGRLRRAVPGGP